MGKNWCFLSIKCSRYIAKWFSLYETYTMYTETKQVSLLDWNVVFLEVINIYTELAEVVVDLRNLPNDKGFMFLASEQERPSFVYFVLSLY